jgi:hypothetical protein
MDLHPYDIVCHDTICHDKQKSQTHGLKWTRLLGMNVYKTTKMYEHIKIIKTHKNKVLKFQITQIDL